MGYIKHHKRIVLIENGKPKILFIGNWWKKPIAFSNLYQIMIENGGMMKCGDQSNDVKFPMCDYHFKIHMFVTKWVVVMLL